MNRPTFLSLTAGAGALSIGLLAINFGSNVPEAAAQAAQSPAPRPDLPASPKAADVVDAAGAFLATLSGEQRAIAQVELTPQLAVRWTNFPGGSNVRNGVFYRDLKPKQVEAALKVAKIALGEEGFSRYQEVRAADDVFAKGRGGRGPGGPGAGPGGPGGMFEQSDANKDGQLSRDEAPGFLRDQFSEIDTNKDGFISLEEDTAFMRQRGAGGPGGDAQKKAGGAAQKKAGGPGGGGAQFGSANYMIAFLGKPSKATPWILQLGGHHLAINIYYKGTAGAATPYHVAAQPTVWKDDQGKTHDPLAPMRDSLHGLLVSLTPEQSKRAKLDARFNDVYVGPQKDGKFPAKSEGVPVSELSDASKDFVKKAIAAWTGDSPQGAEYRKLYEAELDKIKVSYSGTTAVGDRGDYVRIDGPRVWIEFATQGSDHYHTIWRDRLADYGAEFSF
jgi:Protein of unknown function (DUF3500)/EF hand